MKQILLAAVLIAGAIGVFIGGRALLPTPAPVAVLGDLTAMQAIVSDVQTVAQAGDLPAAALRISDLETAWDDAEATLQPMNPEAWGRVDGVIDDALSALRADTPDAGAVMAALAAVTTTMADPGAADSAVGGLVMVGGIAVTDASGHPLPCETMLTRLRETMTATPPQGDAAATVNDLLAKATERCNADDDKNADAFSAQALQALGTQ
jgi:hypothetical protein